MPPFDREAASAAFSGHARYYDDVVVGPVDEREWLDENVVVGTANRRERLPPVAHPGLNRCVGGIVSATAESDPLSVVEVVAPVQLRST